MKKALCLLALMFCLVGMTGCDLKTTVDYDSTVDFTALKTYSWVEPENLEISDLNHRRIIAAVDSELEMEGLKLVDADPDVVVTYFTDDDEQIVVDTTHMGYGYGPGMYWDPYWGGGMSTSTSRVHTYTEGTLIVDIYSASEKQLVWRGAATATIGDNPKDVAKKIQKAVTELFKKYPPAQKSS